MTAAPRSRRRSAESPEPLPERPTPPVEPALEDCCGSGCDPCIFDLYEQQREIYQRALLAWEEAQERAQQQAAAQPAQPRRRARRS